MSQTVDIVLSVIERMDLTDKDIELLKERLNQKTQPKQIVITPMTKKELLQNRIRKELISRKILFPPIDQ